MLELARKCGINSARSRIEAIGGKDVLLAFDSEWRLSPAYDLTPSLAVSHERRDFALECGDLGRFANRKNLLTQHSRFFLKEDEARAIIDNMAVQVKNTWCSVVRGQGVSARDTDTIAKAFVYDGFFRPDGHKFNVLFISSDNNEDLIVAKLSTFLWFDNQAEQAAELYTSLFTDGRVLKKVKVPLAGKNGDKVMHIVEFEMNGQAYSAINGGPLFPFNQSFSLVVHCDTQEELDNYWEKLTANGGAEVQCGWLRDKFGVYWQIVPSFLPQLMGNGEGARVEAVMRALREMIKIDIAGLQKAYDQSVP